MSRRNNLHTDTLRIYKIKSDIWAFIQPKKENKKYKASITINNHGGFMSDKELFTIEAREHLEFDSLKDLYNEMDLLFGG